MMNFSINGEELAAMAGLPHLQQLVYLRGIRPYMDIKTYITGIKRGISLQSIAEQLYIEPHQGIKEQRITRAQVRRAIESLERVGLIENHSNGKKLILKCLFAARGYSVQNKVITNPSQEAVTEIGADNPVNTMTTGCQTQESDTVKSAKVITPHKENNYIYLLRQFEHFWQMYPEKKSRERAFEAFQQINPDESLLQSMLQALNSQIKARSARLAHGEWMPAWKYPANWLAQKCWEDEVNTEVLQEKKYAKDRRSSGRKTPTSGFYIPDDFEDDDEHIEERGKVYDLAKHKKAQSH